MPIIDLQRSIAEAGRIRIGQQVPAGNGRTRPAKLDTFRFTSPDKSAIERVAGLYRGTVRPWAAPAGPQWEVVTETAEIPVIVPPSAMAFSQHLELWSAGGCQRRCDGQTEQLGEQPCLCDPDKRECDYATRLSVMLRDIPGLALWRIDTQGWYAARELAGAVEIITLAAGHGILLPARLLLEQRSVKRPDKNGKPQTLRFAVPRLDPGITPGELLLSGQPVGLTLQAVNEVRALPEGRPHLTPVPRIDAPLPTIAEQSAPPAARPARRNAAPEIPASGRRRSSTTAAPKTAGDDGYWRSRAFADGAERGVDADRMREIAAARAEVPVDEFSMSSLDEADWEQIHRIVLGFSPLEATDDVVDGLFAEDPSPAKKTKREAVPPPPPPLTAPELKDLIQGGTVSLEFAGEIFRRRFPTVKNLSELDDDERGRYWHEVVATAARQAEEG